MPLPPGATVPKLAIRDPKLASRLAEQEAKEATGEKSFETPRTISTGQAAIRDPKLASRLAEQEAKEATGEKSFETPRTTSPSQGPKMEDALAKRLARQLEKEQTGEGQIISPRLNRSTKGEEGELAKILAERRSQKDLSKSESQGELWESPRKARAASDMQGSAPQVASELAARLAEQRNRMQNGTVAGTRVQEPPSTSSNGSTGEDELAKRLAERKAKINMMLSDTTPSSDPTSWTGERELTSAEVTSKMNAAAQSVQSVAEKPINGEGQLVTPKVKKMARSASVGQAPKGESELARRLSERRSKLQPGASSLVFGGGAPPAASRTRSASAGAGRELENRLARQRERSESRNDESKEKADIPSQEMDGLAKVRAKWGINQSAAESKTPDVKAVTRDLVPEPASIDLVPEPASIEVACCTPKSKQVESVAAHSAEKSVREEDELARRVAQQSEKSQIDVNTKKDVKDVRDVKDLEYAPKKKIDEHPAEILQPATKSEASEQVVEQKISTKKPMDQQRKSTACCADGMCEIM